jgi:excinuclease UvrABC helicase subunit UvrB
MHHLGAAPEWMPVLGPDGRQVGRTRVSALQLASRTRFQLDRLLADAEAKMRAAAADADYERAAQHRDEVVAVRTELGRRLIPGPDEGA